MSGGVYIGLTAEELAQAVQSVVQRTQKAEDRADRKANAGRPDTSVDRSDSVPGRDVDLASFGNVTYFPDPHNLNQLTTTDTATSTTYTLVVAAKVYGWTGNAGSVDPEDTINRAQGTNAFGNTFTGWSSNYT